MTIDNSSPEQASKPIIEPELLFTSLNLQIGETARGGEVAVTELVRKNQPLLHFNLPEQEQLKSDLIKRPVTLGANCYFSTDANQVFAAVTGYPKIALQDCSDTGLQILKIAVEPLFRISADRMKAAIAIHPPIAERQSLQSFDIDQLLIEEGIIHGIDASMLGNAKKCIRAGLPEFNVMVIASGNKPCVGTDAYLHFEVETGPIPGKILEDGSIDFRERMIFVPVTKGQVIAQKIPPTRGTPGKSVFGERVEAQAGRDIAVNTLKDAAYSSKTRKVIATNDGVLSVVGDTIIKVCSRQEIMGDIDYSTGHIQSRNCVLIHGSVLPGFKVTTDGDLEIRGTVTSTRISGLSNMVIKSGILGKNSIISALGDTDVYFIEQGEIESGRNCIIRKESYYSTVIAGKNILCKPNSAVVGGKLMAAGNIALGSVGSANAAAALIAAGVDGRRLLLYNELQNSLIEQQDALVKWVQLHKGLPQSKKIQKMEKQIDKTRKQLIKLNVIPGTDRFSRSEDGDEFSAGYSMAIRDVVIEIHGIIYAGTILQIGNRSMTLTNTISHRVFKLSDTLSEIIALPLRRR